MGTEHLGTPAFKWKVEEGKPVETEETIGGRGGGRKKEIEDLEENDVTEPR